MIAQFPIGIDLGTTNSSIAAFVTNKNACEVVYNEVGNRSIPSCIRINNDETMEAGEGAYKAFHFFSDSTIRNFKKIIGRNMNDEIVSQFQSKYKKTVKNIENSLQIEFTLENGKKVYKKPEEISSEILKKLVKFANSNGYFSNQVVITVPAHFNDSQKRSTIEAGKLAGFEHINLINEPTAAALAFGLDRAMKVGAIHNSKILVFDWGGGTLDISILNIDNNKFDVIGVAGDCNLGGEDIDLEIAQLVMNDIQDKNNYLVASDKKVFGTLLKRACEAKVLLSSCQEVIIELNFNMIEYKYKLTRSEFDNICMPYFEKCISLTEKVLLETKLRKDQIDDIVLVGGSTRIQKMREMLQSFFDGKKLNYTINPDEAVVCGAAIRANSLFNKNPNNNNSSGVNVIDVIPFSIGIKLHDLTMDIIIPKHSKYPFTIERIFYTIRDNQEIVTIELFEGENTYILQNSPLGTFVLSGISKKKAGKVGIKIKMEMNLDGILIVTAIEKGRKKNRNQIEINKYCGHPK